VDTNDETSYAESSALDAEVSRRTAFLRRELMQIDERTLTAFVARQPQLESIDLLSQPSGVINPTRFR
jgi:oligoendopeptidase F